MEQSLQKRKKLYQQFYDSYYTEDSMKRRKEQWNIKKTVATQNYFTDLKQGNLIYHFKLARTSFIHCSK